MLFRLSAVALVAATSVMALPSFIHTGNMAPVISSVQSDVIPDSYIVVFKDGIRANDHSAWVHGLHKRDLTSNGVWDSISSGVKHVYDHGSFQGIAGRFRPDVLDEIRRNPDVDYIERDQVMYTSETQRGATWGLARISHRRKLTLGTFNKYEYDSDGGKDVTVYVIDTGVYVDHKDFEGRATWGKTIPSGDDDVDGNGHGSHCAGTIAGKTYGVAKKANIVAVKVLRSNGSGSMSDVVGGIVFASEQHLERQKSEGSKYRGSVANMSLGGGKSRALDDAVTRAIKTGLHFAVAAGNDNKDACNYSPANVETAVTVGASTLSDDRAYFSNHGECVDIFAPGLNIKSVWNNGGTNTISGTSMASPHVAGLIAYYLSIAPASTSAFHSGPMTPSEMKAYLIERATDGALSDLPKNTVNKLIYNNIVDSAFYAW